MLQRLTAAAAMSAAAFVLAAAAAVPAHAAGKVEVAFVDADKFADIGRGAYDRERVLGAMGDFMKSLGATLPEGQTLKLEVTDVDLAGELLPFGRTGSEVRVMSGRADWPHITLRYSLRSGDQVLKAGEARLSDMNYLLSLRLREQGEFGYEKRLLRSWFDANFGAH